MAIQKKKRIKMEIRNNTVDIMIDISIKLRNIYTALILCICIIIVIIFFFPSSLNENARRVVIDALLWVLQILIFGEERLRR